MSRPDRTREDGEFLLSKLTQLQSFNNFVNDYLQGSQLESLVNICRCMQLGKFEAGTILFVEGEKSNNKFYVILDGCVNLIKRIVYDIDQDTKKVNRQKEIYSNYYSTLPYGTKSIIWNLVKNIQLQQHADDKLDQEPFKVSLISEFCVSYGGIFRILKTGDGFGEKALIENKHRTLTAIVDQTSYMIMLDKQDFDKIREAFEYKIKQRKDLLFHIFQDVLNEYSTIRLESMAYSFKSLELDKGQILVKTDEKSDTFYLLENGEVKIYQNSEQVLPLSIITPGQFIGEEITINLNSCYEFTGIISSQSANLLIVTKGVFYSQFPQECRNSVLTTYESKKTTRIQTLERFNQNEEFLSMRQTYCAGQFGTKSRQHQLQSLNTDTLDKQLAFRQFEQNYQSPIVRRFDQVWNRQAINLTTLREKSNKYMSQKTDHSQLNRQQKSENDMIMDAQVQSLTVRKSDNNDYQDVIKIVESTKAQYMKKQFDCVKRVRDYGLFLNEDHSPSKDRQPIVIETESTIKPSNRLDFGRGDIERQLRREHFFKIMKVIKPVKPDYMDHNFHILKSVIGKKFKKNFIRSEMQKPRTFSNCPSQMTFKSLNLDGISPLSRQRLPSQHQIELLTPQSKRTTSLKKLLSLNFDQDLKVSKIKINNEQLSLRDQNELRLDTKKDLISSTQKRKLLMIINKH